MSQNPLKNVAGKDTGFDGLDPDIIRGAKNNDISEVRAALKIDWKVITKRDLTFKMSALHYAAARGNSSMVSFLLEQKGADINLKDRWGRDPLDVAILSGNQDIIDDMFKFRHGEEPDENDPEPEPPLPSGDIITLKPQ
ncbi:MAG: hypothetical protein COA52_20260 [Hyphomicrobiales bacterium]|nr:MAG: hypothetical protein COA52_20260 [Hyphomicrobiales bacterium]